MMKTFNQLHSPHVFHLSNPIKGVAEEAVAEVLREVRAEMAADPDGQADMQTDKLHTVRQILTFSYYVIF